MSLVLSDLLCSLVSLPISASEMFFDVFLNDWVCKVLRFFNIFFPAVTIYSYLVIGIERYLGIFCPFSVISPSKAKKMVIGAWVLGFLVTLIPTTTYRRVYYDIGRDYFTLICKYDNTVTLYRILFTIFLLIIYIIPSIILLFINTRIIRYHKNHVPMGSAKVEQKSLAKRRITRMFVSLIFAFVVPYLLFIAYSAFMMILKPDVPLAFDFVARHFSALLGYANGAISAIILVHNDKYLRRKVIKMFCGIDVDQSKIAPETAQIARSKDAKQNQGFEQQEDASSIKNSSNEEVMEKAGEEETGL